MKTLIEKPRKLLKVEASEHWSFRDNPHNTRKLYREITIETSKGTYLIESCVDCSGLFWIKVE